MKKFLIFLLTVALIGSGVYIYLIQNGHNLESIMNTPDKIDLSVNCDDMENLLLTTTVQVKVNNLSSRSHKDVKVKITAYDADGNIVKQKDISFLRELGPKGDMSKPVTLPAKTVSCDCVVLDSNPQ